MKKKRRSLAERIFDLLADGGELVLIAALKPSVVLDPDMRARVRKAFRDNDQKQIAQTVRRLEKRDLLERVRKGNQLSIRLTETGSEAAIRRAIVEKKITLPSGTYCYVSFDIPERVKYLRHQILKLLKEAAFSMVHQSMWMTERDVGAELAAFMKGMDAIEFIHVFQGQALTAAIIRPRRTVKR